MPFEQIAMLFMAMLMLMAATAGSAVARTGADPIKPEIRHHVDQTDRTMIVDGHVQNIDLKKSMIVVTVNDAERTYKVLASAPVTKDDMPVELGALMNGDYAVLHLVSVGSDVVTRIQAVSSRGP